MPVYERGYTHWQPSGERAYPAWWVIARRGITEPLKSRWLLILISASWVPALVKGIMIYLTIRAGNLLDVLAGNWSSIDATGFLAFLEGQRFPVFILLAIVGAGLIARDRRDNGLSLYFSRPLGLRGYVGGKAAIIIFYYFLVTLFPTLALCLFSYLVAPEAGGVELLLLIPLRVLLFCSLMGLGISLVLLAFSSLGKRSIFVMVWWTILVMGTETLQLIAKGLGNSSLQAINFLGNYHNAGAWLFGAEPRLGVSSGVSLAVVLVLTGAAIVVLRRRIRPVEVVS
ncbi:hypothetical protein CSA17_03400 [bacterium DOLJORAL78_65_58]|nr:MAG: hypothetical protein CSB20_13815 [bacterium DOLZORAL124_64_63]PIE76225.1 MAG: hypothetical protein CSA17_03400 [bacterium DOLJORAL78_65_58]